ncbi:MAG: hypothetical protein QOF43_1529, partial [Gaiellaceae bacterium]|nr:hypothetical protein [Gaiellaceae bacterium]
GAARSRARRARLGSCRGESATVAARVLSRARGRDAELRDRLGQVERLAAEWCHGARPFVTRSEQDARTAELTDRMAERAAQRERHEHDLGRGL